MITKDNVEAACRVSVRPDQEKFSSPVAWSLAEAYAQPEIAWPRLIVEDDEIVGFLMGFFDIVWDPAQSDDRRSGLWRLNIAAEHQGRGTAASRYRPFATRPADVGTTASTRRGSRGRMARSSST